MSTKKSDQKLDVILDDLKRLAVEKQTDVIEVKSPPEIDTVQTPELKDWEREIMSGFEAGVPDQLKASQKVVLPWLLQSSWLPLKGSPKEHVRSFGRLSIVSRGAMLPNRKNIGLPSGLIARRVLLALTTMAARHRARTIEVPSISWLLNWTRLSPTGHQHKRIQRNLYQMNLMDTNIFMKGEGGGFSIHSGKVFDSISVEVVDDGQQSFSFIPREVSFTERFFERVIHNQGVAYDADMVLTAPTPFIHDVLLWLLHRGRDERNRNDGLWLTYESLLPQFGRPSEMDSPAQFRKFKARMKKALLYINQHYGLRVVLEKKRIHIPHRPKSLTIASGW
jgi:hypothetical protein